MKTHDNSAVQLRNWVSGRFVLVPGIIGLVLAALGWLSPWWYVPAVPVLVVSVYFIVARRLFAPQGGNLQQKVINRLVAEVQWPGRGRVLDIGCGSGALSIRLAREYTDADVAGVDSWGKGWDYSKQLCENNAAAAGVGDRLSFRQGSATDLPFDDDSFDLVVSNLVFHEVHEARDKTVCLKEALRVLKRGGVFVLQDLFLLKPYFGSPESLPAMMREFGASDVSMIRTCDEPFIPAVVKLPFMLGTVALVKGRK